jgi:hypothetical protein
MSMPPGEHPRRNWQPATTVGDYLRNCREGLGVVRVRRAPAAIRQTIAEWLASEGAP